MDNQTDRMVSVVFTLPWARLQELDAEAKTRGKTRSWLIREALGPASDTSPVHRPSKPRSSSSPSPADAEKVEGTPEWIRRMLTTGQGAKVRAWQAAQDEEF